MSGDITGTVFNIQRYSIDDGPGIRTTVFVKGCPLRCPWCSNPESQNPKPELLYRYTACTHCGTCAATCPVGAITLDAEQNVIIDRKKCTVCGKCVETCPAKAMTLTGKVMTADEVMKTVVRDEAYYDDGGGVTCSGGEILSQADFVTEIFRQSKERGIHTNADTSGFGKPEDFKKILEYSDLCYFDVKILDPERHKEIIGVPIDVIKENLQVLADSGVEVTLRFPLVPGYNDDDQNLSALIDLVKGFGRENDWHVNILPYHKYGENKYASVGMVYPMPDVAENSEFNLDRVSGLLKDAGLKVEVSK